MRTFLTGADAPGGGTAPEGSTDRAGRIDPPRNGNHPAKGEWEGDPEVGPEVGPGMGMSGMDRSGNEKRLRKGDKVAWNTPAGRISGIVQKVVTRETRIRGKRVRGSEEDPVYIVRSTEGTASLCKEVALKMRP